MNAEENYSWKTFLSELKERGLKDVRMVISDSHKSIRKSVAEVYPEAGKAVEILSEAYGSGYD